jgi:hypothetical protein
MAIKLKFDKGHSAYPKGLARIVTTSGESEDCASPKELAGVVARMKRELDAVLTKAKRKFSSN